MVKTTQSLILTSTCQSPKRLSVILFVIIIMNAVILKELNDLKRRVEAIEVWGNPFPPTLSPTHSSRKTPEAEAEAEEQINAVYTIERIKRIDKSKGSGKVFTATNKYKGKVGFGVWARSPHFKVSQTLDVGDHIFVSNL